MLSRRLFDPLPELRHLPKGEVGRGLLHECFRMVRSSPTGRRSELLASVGGGFLVATPIVRTFVSPAVFYLLMVVAICVLAIGTRSFCRLLSLHLREAMLRRGICPCCGYDLRGCASDRCPECGCLCLIASPANGKADDVVVCGGRPSSFFGPECLVAWSLAVLAVLVTGLVCQKLATFSQWSGGMRYAAVWGGFLLQGMAGWGVAVVLFVAGFGLGLIGRRHAPASISSSLIRAAVYVAAISTVIFMVTMLVGFAFN